jgi:hypothetical protein
LDEAKKEVLPLEVDWAGQTLSLEYQPGKLTDDWYDDVQDATDEDDIKRLAKTLCDVVVSWDMVLSKEKGPVALKAEAILEAKIPMPLIGLVNRKIQEDASTGGKHAKKRRRAS